MNILREYNRAPHVATLSIVAQNEAFLAIIEANEKDPNIYRKGLLSDLALRAARKLDLGGQERVVAFAEALESEIKLNIASGRPPDAVFLGVVSCGPDSLTVCTAGDIRIHHLADNLLVNMSRDHNYACDVYDDKVNTAGPGSSELLYTVPTRWIGGCPREPEVVTWEAKAPYSLFVCTSQFHHYRLPEQYLDPSHPTDLYEAMILGDASYAAVLSLGSVG